MKHKFAYLYISFIVSLIIVIALSFLFYKKLNSHVKYTHEFNDSYTVLMTMKQLRENLLVLVSTTRGFQLTRDSSLLPSFTKTRDSIYAIIDSLKGSIDDNTDQMRRFLLMKSMVNQEVNICNRSLLLDTADKET